MGHPVYVAILTYNVEQPGVFSFAGWNMRVRALACQHFPTVRSRGNEFERAGSQSAVCENLGEEGGEIFF